VVRGGGTWRSTVSARDRRHPISAKEHSFCCLREWYMIRTDSFPHICGAFGDVNPPVHALGCVGAVYKSNGAFEASPIAGSSKKVFHKLLLNFTWGESERSGRPPNIFPRRLSGLDNIGVFDRSVLATADTSSSPTDSWHGYVLPEYAGDRA